ncbi:HupE/UreJ family protein [Gluconacetobacter tumulisoli]|uniref:HupE/UreJ family protein n=1 Tax=Gluconacetobacter tumulisoli TaxID=1286189 RepID=A0A7W4K9X8_9PROT|nr:HupE/UreJ family protein [Gluconacetobacter tumulisoli]MBB2203054.1 HupE/UreJ family protein [Gluconacetobacter tumulisoli]
MRARLLVLAAALGGLAGLATPALAHRLDEYLQAATIAVEKDHVTAKLRLTPGIDVAPKVLAGIDPNGDDLVSTAEQQAYAAQVRQDLSLAIDGHAAPLRLVSSSFPPKDAIRNGVGEIVLGFEACMPSGGSTHELTFENRHDSALAVYLVNTLLPRDPDIHILRQERSYNQSTYRLAFALDTPVVRLAPSETSGVQRQSRWQNALPIVQTFFWHGIHHILTGYDHLLFISALVLGAATLWDLVKVVTAFTVAHSITLTLAALNLIHLPDAVVEPLIAASIVFVAVQNIVLPDQTRGRTRLAAAFVFGLFHGLGFAGGLLDLMHQMPKGTILLAILGFSLGVEAGNQMVLLPLFGLLKAVRHSPSDTRPRAPLARTFQRTGSAGIAVAGLYYLCIALTSST